MYCVIELQLWADGSLHPLTYIKDSENAAWSKYHEVLKYAAISENPAHSAIILTESGQVLPRSGQCYTHYVAPPEPEEIPEEEE